MRTGRTLLAATAVGLLVGLTALPAAAQDSGPSVTLYPEDRLEASARAGVAFSSDGQWIAGARDEEIRLWDAGAMRRIETLSPEIGDIRALVFTDEGRLVAAGEDGRVAAVELVSREVTARAELDADIRALDSGPSGRLLAGGEGGYVAVLGPDLRPIRRLEAPNLYDKDVRYVVLGAGGEEAFAAAEDGETATWTVGTGRMVRNRSLTRRQVVGAGRSGGGGLLALGIKHTMLERGMTGGRPGGIQARANYSLRAVDWSSGRTVTELTDFSEPVTAAAVAPNPLFAVTGDDSGTITVWNLRQGTAAASIRAGDHRVTDLAVDPAGNRLAAAVEEEGIAVFEASGLSAEGKPERVYDTGAMLSQSRFEFSSSSEPFITFRDRTLTLAVLGLQSLGADEELARSVTSLLTSRLSNFENVRLVERAAIEKVIGEQEFQQTGITSPDDAARIGRVLNAGKVIVGSLNRLGSSLVLSVRMVDSETAEVDGARELVCNDCRPEDLPRAVTLLVEAMVEAGG